MKLAIGKGAPVNAGAVPIAEKVLDDCVQEVVTKFAEVQFFLRLNIDKITKAQPRYLSQVCNPSGAVRPVWECVKAERCALLVKAELELSYGAAVLVQ